MRLHAQGIGHSIDGLRVLSGAGLRAFVQEFLRMLCDDGITAVEFAGTTRGHFLMARGVGQGCPASGFLFHNGV